MLRTGSVHRGTCRGFTLIELVVTITLIGILVALGVPSFTIWIKNTQVRTVAEALQNGLRLSQTEALRRNQQVVMTFTNDANPKLNPNAVAGGKSWSSQTVASPYNNGNVAQFIEAGALTSIASGVTIAGTIAVPAICFNANGRLMTQSNVSAATTAATANCTLPVAGTPLKFQIAQSAPSDRPLNVLVQLGGQIRVCDPSAATLSATSPQGCP